MKNFILSIKSFKRLLKLSQKRSSAVRDYLIEAGIPARQLGAEGYGSSKPVAPNDSASGRAKNRRVNFVIVKPEPPVPQESTGEQ